MNKKCQVFTPVDYVEKLLDNVGYIENLYGKKILENSCGDGNILVAIVQRYINDCKKHGFSNTKIINGLSRDIYGVEIDPDQYVRCICRLNSLLDKNGLKNLEWNVINEDYLRKNDNIKYEFIVGNPPYITYKEMEEKDRLYLKNNFISCKKGKFDYCYAFIEKSIKSLADDGRMVYLIPSSIFKTVFGSNLREYIKPYIKKIIDFTQEKMFGNALVKSSIILLDTKRKDDIVSYIDVTLHNELVLPIDRLGEKWFFTNNAGQGDRRFGDYFKVSHVVATLLNEAYVLKANDYIEHEYYFERNNRYIERAVVMDAASPRSLRYKKNEKIIFPYFYKNHQLGKYSEDEFKRKFPGAFAYLNDFREKLDKRESDNNAKWFEYGRSQALNGLNVEKLLISTVITTNVEIYLLNEWCIPYAGMYITTKTDNDEFTIEDAMEVLLHREFMQYVLDVGIHISGSSLRITSKDIEDYRF